MSVLSKHYLSPLLASSLLLIFASLLFLLHAVLLDVRCHTSYSISVTDQILEKPVNGTERLKTCDYWINLEPSRQTQTLLCTDTQTHTS